MAQIKFIKKATPVGYANPIGDVASYPDAVCESLVESGFAVYVVVEVADEIPTAKIEKAVKKK